MRIPCHLIKSCFLCLTSFCFWVQYVSKPYQECAETLEKETSYLRTPGTEKYCPSTHDFVHHEKHTTIISNEAFWHIAVPLYCLAIMCFGTICFFLFFFYRNHRMSNRIHGLSFSQQGNDMPSIPQVSVDDVLSGVGGFSGALPQADEISGFVPIQITSTVTDKSIYSDINRTRIAWNPCLSSCILCKMCVFSSPKGIHPTRNPLRNLSAYPKNIFLFACTNLFENSIIYGMLPVQRPTSGVGYDCKDKPKEIRKYKLESNNVFTEFYIILENKL